VSNADLRRCVSQINKTDANNTAECCREHCGLSSVLQAKWTSREVVEETIPMFNTYFERPKQKRRPRTKKSDKSGNGMVIDDAAQDEGNAEEESGGEVEDDEKEVEGRRQSKRLSGQPRESTANSFGELGESDDDGDAEMVGAAGCGSGGCRDRVVIDLSGYLDDDDDDSSDDGSDDEDSGQDLGQDDEDAASDGTELRGRAARSCTALLVAGKKKIGIARGRGKQPGRQLSDAVPLGETPTSLFTLSCWTMQPAS